MQPDRRFLPRLVCVCILLLAGCQGDADAVGNGTVDSASPPELARRVERMLPALERLSGLDRIDVLRVRMQTRDGARSYMERRLAEEMPPSEMDAVRRSYVALGLIPDTLDLPSLLLDLYTEQVLGYYDPRESTLFLVEGHSPAELDGVMAHELVHALQDQHANLDSLIARERGNDRQVAAHAAMEGHALLVMFAWLAEQQTRQAIDPAALPNPAQELAGALDAQTSQFPVFGRAPLIIRETLLFPYISGAGFVHALWTSMRPQARYPAPLDSLMPQSTEQVMRPQERFIAARDEPVELSEIAAPPGWTVVHQNTLGQLETAIFLQHHLGAAAREAANGWGGDRYVLLSDGTIDLIEWRSVWDTESDAARFADAAMRSAGTRRGRHITVERQVLEGRPGVRIIDAPAGALLPAWHGEAGAQTGSVGAMQSR